MNRTTGLLAGILLAGAAANVHATPIKLTISAENLAPENSVSFAPLHVSASDGTYDAFNSGEAAAGAIQTVAETGSGAGLFADLAAADSNAVYGSVGGVLTPGATASTSLMVDTDINPYFSFASMVLPSNDSFIGNDSPMAYSLFDAMGNLQVNSITVYASDIWDAGTELFNPAGAAFIGDAMLHEDENGVVGLNYLQLAGFDGMQTGAGYEFMSQLSDDTAIYRISLSAMAVPAVPLPAGLPLLSSALVGFGFLRRRFRAQAVK